MQYDLIIRHAHLHRRDGLVDIAVKGGQRSEEHTSELQSQSNLVCRLLLEKKKSYRKIESLQHRPRGITHFDVPRAGPVGRHGLLAPRAPRRPAHLELHVAHLRVSMEPHVVDARALRSGHLGPADDRPTSTGNVVPVSCGCRSTTDLATTASATSTAAVAGAAAGAGAGAAAFVVSCAARPRAASRGSARIEGMRVMAALPLGLSVVRRVF